MSDGMVSSLLPLVSPTGLDRGQSSQESFTVFYTNNMFKILRKKKTGCWININFNGIIGYSDDGWTKGNYENNRIILFLS